MANNFLTTTSNLQDLPTIWAPELNTGIQFDIVIASLFDSRFEDTMRVGQVMNLISRRNLTTTTKTSGTDASIPALVTETAQTFTITQQDIAVFGVDDITEIQSLYDLRATYTDSAAYAIARAMDVTAAATLTADTTNQQGTAGAELTDDSLIGAWTTLANNAAPLDNRYTIVAPATYAGFLKIDKFVNALYNGDDAGMAVHKAKVGALYNSDVYVSQLLGGTSPTSNGVMAHQSHYVVIRQRTPTVHMEYRALAVGWTVLIDQIYLTQVRLEIPEGANTGAGSATAASKWGIQLLSKQ